MRFVCDSCRAQYMISDDKVGPKGVKVRCKKCSFVILVRRQDDPADEGVETRVMSNPLAPLSEGEGEAAVLSGDTPAPDGDDKLDPNSLFGDDDEDEIGAIFDSVLNSGSHALPGSEEAGDAGLQSTKTLDVASMAKAMDASVSDSSEDDEGRKHELTPALLSNEWYVAIEENQVGPVGIDKLKEHWDRGEIGPDSLCWRAGMADWLPLSDVTELQRHLAPKPTKPVIVAPASMASSASEAPVSGVFTGASAADPSPLTDGGGWKPSAASALASLVKDELDVLARPAPAKKPEVAGSGLLDVPAAPVAAAAVAAAGASAAAPAPLTPAPTPGAFAAPAPGYPAAGYGGAPAPAYGAAPGYAPAPYAVPPYQAAPAEQKKPIALYAVGGLAVLALIMGGVILATRGGDEPTPTPAPAMASAAPPAPAPQAPVAATPPPAAVPAPPATETAAPAVAKDGETPTTVAAAAAAPAETEKPAEVKEEEEDEPKVASRTTSRRRTSTSTPTRRERREPVAAAEPKAAAKSSDPFDDIFGPSSSGSSSGSTKAAASKPSTYVPPAPSSIPAELSSSDITMAVVGKRTAIATCVKNAKAKDPNLGSGRMVMGWTIETNGRTKGVKNQTAQYRGSDLDKCVTGVIQGLRFPQHRKSGGQQVNFPFTF